MSDWLEDAVMLGWQGTRMPSKTRQNRRLYASSAGHCPRKEAFYIATTNDAEVLRMETEAYRAIGVALENVIQEGLERYGILLASNIAIPDIGCNLGGEIDAVVTDLDSNPYIIEIKTCGVLPAKPKITHERQGLVYSITTGIPAILLYFSRNVETWLAGRPILQLRAFELPFDRASLLPVAKAIYKSRFYADLEVNPPIPEGMRKTVDCAYCPFFSICWNGQETLYYRDATESDKEQADIFAAQEAEKLLLGMDDRRNLFLEGLG